MKRFLYLTIISVLTMIALSTESAEADDPPLPCGLRWGASRERCGELLAAGGYARLIRSEDYASSKSPDRLLRRVRETQGISVLEFEREQKGITEMLKATLYKDNLFQIEIMFSNTKQSFADQLVEDLSRNFAQSPRSMEGENSKLRAYIWAFPVTVVVFSYRYGSPASTAFAALDYRNEPFRNELKSKGLM